MTYTTKQEFVAAFEALIAPIEEKLITSLGQPDFGHTATVYCQDAIYAEAFLRSLWGLVPYWHGGNGNERLKEGMRRGIVAGTDPAGEHYWGACGKYDQRFVEMAPLAFGLLLVPEILWEPLSERERDNLEAWLLQVNDQVIPDNNWHFFRVLVNLALKHLGRRYSEEQMEADLSRVEEFYLANGWYGDGARGQRDYYVAWAIHYYGLIYAMFEEDDYATRYRARAKAFAEDFIYWFSDRGEAVAYGRSLTYRMAQGSFWSMCALAGVEVLELAVVKGLLSRHLDSWLSLPIFDNSGALTIGYGYPNLMMAEHYNAPGSPYWGMKFFAFLALADDHPFWALEAAPMPVLAERKLIREADMLAVRHGGDAFLYVGGTMAGGAFGQMGPKYLRFVYSTRFGFNLKLGDMFLIEGCPDSTLLFDVGGVLCDRRSNGGFTQDEKGLAICWSPMEGIAVTTTLVPDAHGGHSRHHVIESQYDCTAYDCGYAIACRDEDGCVQQLTSSAAEARNRFSLCRVSSCEDGAEPQIVAASPNSNILFNKTVVPVVKYVIPAGHSEFVTRIEVE